MFGWSIWIWEGVYIEAKHHAVWRRPDGTLLDVTPAREGEGRRLFLPDPHHEFDFVSAHRRDNVRAPLTSDPIVAEFLKVAAEWSAFIEAHSEGLHVNFSRAEAAPIAVRRDALLAQMFRCFASTLDPTIYARAIAARRLSAVAVSGLGDASEW